MGTWLWDCSIVKTLRVSPPNDEKVHFRNYRNFKIGHLVAIASTYLVYHKRKSIIFSSWLLLYRGSYSHVDVSSTGYKCTVDHFGLAVL